LPQPEKVTRGGGFLFHFHDRIPILRVRSGVGTRAPFGKQKMIFSELFLHLPGFPRRS
jgi:hypothetical protein